MYQRPVKMDKWTDGMTYRHLDELRIFLFEGVISGLNEVHRMFSQSLL